MPELPEVETVKNGLQDLVGTKIKDWMIRCPSLRYPLEQKQLSLACGQRIISISRRAKYLIFKLENGYLIFHLGMSGRLTLYKNPEVAPDVLKHDHVDLLCDDFILRYNDQRRFGCILFSSSLEKQSILVNLGPEPLTPEFNSEYLADRVSDRNTPIKQLIMDNSIVVGVGNIYACEALFLSKVAPTRPGKSLSNSELSLLTANIKAVLTKAIAAGGSTLRDYKNARGELGYFQQSHNVYGKARQACSLCDSIILEVRLGQRNSFYCPSCQK